MVIIFYFRRCEGYTTFPLPKPPYKINHNCMRTLFVFLCFFCIHLSANSQYATTGTGVLRNQIWWFDWANFTLANGATRSFTTDDGLQVTISFSGVVNPVLVPSVMNTWSGSLLHVLYNFTDPAVKPALFRSFDLGGITDTRFTMNILVTRNGQPTPFTFVAADAESSTVDEVTTFTTTGSNWTTLEFFRNSAQTTNPLTGCGTSTIAINSTQGSGPINGQNPIIATNAAGQLSIGTTLINPVRGGMAVAFGLFSPVDRGDLPVSYGYAQHRLLYTNSNGCNYMPPFPAVIQDTRLKIGTMPGDADNVQSTDDNTNGNDEDGLSFFPFYTGSGSYSLTVPVINTTSNPAYLTGWMDKNKDAQFNPGESVTTTVAPSATSATLTWSGLPPILPAGSTPDVGFRFRLASSQAESMQATGFANDGEVEDYLAKLVNDDCSGWLHTPSQNAYMSVGDLDIQGNKLTIEALINRTQPYSPGVGDDNDGDIVSKHLGPPNTNYLLRPNHGYITTTNGFFATPDICDIELNNTYHLAMVYDGASLKFYRNGDLMGQTAASGNLFQNDYPTRIGRYSGITVENFLGYIDEVRIWNTARTQAEIQATMQGSLPSPGTQTGLQAYYTFDNLLNKQGNAAWNGVLAGAAQINTTNPSCDLATTTCRQPDQPGVASFATADTICVNNTLNITNTSTGQTTNYWNFCVSDITSVSPTGVNIGNPGNTLSLPVFGDFVEQNGNYYLFVVNNSPSQLIRLDFGNSMLNTPTARRLITFTGNFSQHAEGIQVVKEGNQWYAIIVGGDSDFGTTPQILKVEFGSDIANPAPTYISWGNINNQMAQPIDLHVFKEGGQWYGFAVNAKNNSFTRFNFSSNFASAPTIYTFNIPQLVYPTGIYVMNDQGNWRVFITNGLSSSITRLDFGTSLLNNTPVAVSLGNPNNTLTQPRDIYVIKSCEKTVGFVVNQGSNDLIRLNFDNGLSQPPTGTSLGNIGNFSFPHSISKLFRVNDDLYSFVTNVNNNTITRLRFAGCTNASIPSSTATNPPPITYNAPGTYNINLTVDDGLPTQASFCKPVVVLPPPPHTATPTYTICAGNPPIKIGRDITGTTTYQWNTGATTDSIDISQPGIYWVDMTRFGCTTRDSFLLKEETASFSFTQDLCNPLQVTFYNGYTNPVSSNWDFGNGTSTQTNPTTTYGAYGQYTVSLAVETASGCRATITKPVTIAIKTDSVIITNDTTICHDATLPLRSVAGVAYCWYPATGLSATNIANPVATPPTSPMTYYVHAQVVGQNIVTNGDFSQGNTGFTSAYVYSPNNTTEGQYMVSPFPRNWNPNVQACNDHTTGSGNMMMVNGSPVADVNVWKQTIAVTPNTDYAFSTWIQAIHIQNPARLQFSINDQQLGALISADPVPCTWKQFYTIWNSGSATSATISIINKNTIIAGNDFALDDISFAPVTLQKDSIIISRERPVVTASGNEEICEKRSTTLSAAGAATYTWSPASGLDNANSPAPVASPTSTTTYTVTGTTLKGCTDDDAITITVHPAPGITITEDTAICKNSSVQLSASGGNTYSWTPAATLDDASSPRPLATPGTAPVKYYVTVTDARTCTNTDSVMVSIRPDPVFTVSADKTICDRDTIRITAGGGDIYSWLPAATLSDPGLAAPLAFPSVLTTYSVHITDTVCDNSADLTTTIRVNPLPNVVGSSTNDLDCSYGSSQLNATGARRYLWSPAVGLSNPAIANPVASPLTAIDYVVKGTDMLGCSNTDTVKVALLTTNKGDNLVPNAFTPNGDGKNDCFGIKYWGVIEKIDFSVYNRWGERVFYTNMPNGCWDGVYKGKKQDGNVFVYYIRAVTNCGIIERKGTVVLIQ